MNECVIMCVYCVDGRYMKLWSRVLNMHVQYSWWGCLYRHLDIPLNFEYSIMYDKVFTCPKLTKSWSLQLARAVWVLRACSTNYTAQQSTVMILKSKVSTNFSWGVPGRTYKYFENLVRDLLCSIIYCTTGRGTH